MNKKTYFVIIAIVFLIILRFGVIPKLSKTASASCAVPTLNDLLESAKLIIVGESIAERVQTQRFFNRGMIFTYTTIGDIEIVKGKLDKTTLETRQVYGCDILTGYCVYSSAASPFEIGKRYLLFLEPALKFQPTQAEPPPATFGQKLEVQDAEGEIEEGVYAGFSGCGGKYLLKETTTIDEIKEIINSGDETKWQEFLGTIRETTSVGISPQPTVSPGQEI